MNANMIKNLIEILEKEQVKFNNTSSIGTKIMNILDNTITELNRGNLSNTFVPFD